MIALLIKRVKGCYVCMRSKRGASESKLGSLTPLSFPTFPPRRSASVVVAFFQDYDLKPPFCSCVDPSRDFECMF